MKMKPAFTLIELMICIAIIAIIAAIAIPNLIEARKRQQESQRHQPAEQPIERPEGTQ
jgi:prepilin-type N-terminal cleavage/methylation domain-containing protein